MRLKDISIGTQLRIGQTVILAFVLLLGAVSFFQANSLWETTKGLNEHPLQVQRALASIAVDTLSIRRSMEEVIAAEKDRDREKLIYSIDVRDADTDRQIDILYDRYLGPKSDIDDARNAIVEWKSIRDETIRLLRAGDVAGAAARTRSGGAGAIQADKIVAAIQKVSDFAFRRGDLFFREAESHRNDLLVRFGILLGAIILVSALVSHFLLLKIRGPLSELLATTERHRQGDLSVRSNYASANEFGALSSSFNALADAIEREMLSQHNAIAISNVMLQEQEPGVFCQELLKVLLERTGSQVGAIYILNEQTTDFELFESIGLRAEGRASFSATAREGEFGAALATHQIQRVSSIPADTRFTFPTVSGDFVPREIVTIPVLSGEQVVAMVSLASIRDYASEALQLINNIWSVLAVRVNGVLAFRQIRKFSEKLESQNRELEAQAKELALQADELSEQNIELELQKNQLGETNRLKSNFLSNMSHELRTPLNSVISLSNVLNRRLRDVIPEEEFGYLAVIERNGKHLLSLINDILDLSRIESGREEICLSCFSIRGVVAEVAAMIEPQASEKSVVLINNVSGDLPSITSDVTKCLHILKNLIGNAVKFTEEGKVEISARQVGRMIQIAVADTGIGISPEKLPYIFDEFRQGDESTSRRFGGTGLGLAIARKYAALLQGGIEVESTPGVGSTFTLNLPMTLDEPFPPAQTVQSITLEPVEPPVPPSGEGRRVLLVEDSEPAVIQMTDILSKQGYQVEVARNGKEALQLIERTLPDAMILDLMMPEVDGFQVLRAVRDEEKTALLPVLILTAKHVTRDELSFLRGNDIHQLIQKGDISKTELLAAVGNMVSPKRRKRMARVINPSAEGASGRAVILVVEDNADNLKTIKALLGDKYNMIEASDGQTGVEQAKRHSPDLILMDISLPLMDGFQALAAIRKVETLRHVPVIALTAKAMKGDREQILDYGFDGYISKPIDHTLLTETIQEHLHGHQ